MTRRRRARSVTALVILAAPSLVLAIASCVEPRDLGSELPEVGAPDRAEAGADRVAQEEGPLPPPDDVVCPDGEILSMGKCLPELLCAPTQLDGSCPDGQSCEMGKCLVVPTCSPKMPTGTCEAGFMCEMGTCVPMSPSCSMMKDAGCPMGELCTPTGTCQPDPCLKDPCMELLCCTTLAGDSYAAKCVMGMKCP